MEHLTVTFIKPQRGFLQIYGHKKPELLNQLELEISAYQPYTKKIATTVEIHPNLEFDTIYLALNVRTKKYHRCTVQEKRSGNKAFIELVDYGNVFEVDTSLLLPLDPKNGKADFLKSFPPIATSYYLANFFCNWKQNERCVIEPLLLNSTLPITNEQVDREYRYISLDFKGNDVAQKLISSGLGMEISFTEQRMEVRKMHQRTYDVFSNGSPAGNSGSPARREKRRQLVPNRPLQTLPNNNTITDLSKRLIQSHLAPNSQRNYAPVDPIDLTSQRAGRMPAFTANELPPGQFYIVYSSYVENGPHLFWVQLKSHEHVLDRLANEIANVPRVPLTSKISPGMACIVRYSEDKALYRAVIQSQKNDKCRVTFVDYGNSETVPCSEMFEIPANLLEPKTYAMPFQLHGCNELGTTDQRLNRYFETLISDKVLDLKVIPVNGAQVQQCEMFLPNGANVLHLLKEKKSQFFSYPNPPQLKDSDYVVLRYSKSAKQFYVQRHSDIPAYDSMMDALLEHCEHAPPMTSLPSNEKCCAAKFKDEWYRAIVTHQTGPQKFALELVDFGFRVELPLSELRDIAPQFMELPRQAIECCLVDFENYSGVPDASICAQLDMLVEDANNETIKYRAQIRRRLQNSVYVVELINEKNDVRVSVSVYKNVMPLGPKPYNKPLTKGVNEVEKPPRQAPQHRSNSYHNQREGDGAERPEKFVEANDRPRERYNGSRNDDATRYERSRSRNEHTKPVSNGTTKNYSNRPDTDNRRNGEKSKKPISQKRIIPRFNKRSNRSRNNHNGKRTIGIDHNDNWDGAANEASKLDDPTLSSKQSVEKNIEPSCPEVNKASEPSNQTVQLMEISDNEAQPAPVVELPKSDELEASANQNVEHTKNFVEPMETNEKIEQSVPIVEPSTEVILIDDSIEIPSDVAPIQITPTTQTPAVTANRELAFITHVDSPNRFYLQLNSDTGALDTLQHTLQIVAPQLPLLADFRAGQLCIAFYSADEQWYRAKIIDSDGELTSIQFVDYGNTDSITNNAFLKSADDSLNSRQAIAMACSLPIEPRGSKEWTESACTKLQMLIDTPLEFELISQDKDVNYVKLFFVGGRDIMKELIQEGVADPVEIIKSGETCYVSHINSLSDFFIQVDSDSEALEKIEQFLRNDATAEILTAPAIGTICSAKYDDDCFYRARITSILPDSQGFEVDFVDYGNTFKTNVVRSMNPVINEVPHLRKHCSLKMPDDLQNWSDEAESKFREICDEGATAFKVNLIKPGKTACVELFVNDENQSEVLSKLCERRPPVPMIVDEQEIIKETAPINKHPIHINDFSNGKQFCCLTHINGPDDFYIQFATKMEDLSMVENELAKLKEYEDIEPNDVEVGSIVAALYPADGYFYRAKVIEKFETEVSVQFIDYGNECKTPKIRKLPDILSPIIPLAINCTLSRDKLSHFNQDNKAIFITLVHLDDPENPTFQVEAINAVPPKPTVELYRNDVDILDVIKEMKRTNESVANNILSNIIEEAVASTK